MTLPVEELRALREQGLAMKAAGGDAEGLAALERRIVALVLAPAPPPAPRRLLWACAGFALLVAAAGYAWKGSPGAINPAPPPDRTEEMVQRLAARLQQQPDDAKGWAMLGRSYAVLGRQTEALAAYQKALALSPEDAGLLADLADVRATQQGGSLEGEPAELLDKALRLDPQHTKALALAGTRALRAGDLPGARRHWQALLDSAPPDHPLRESVAQSLAQLPGSAADEAPKPGPAAAPDRVSGTVRLTPELAAQAAPDASLFVFARRAEGPPTPVAVLRVPARELPYRFTLDDRQTMAGGPRLSEAGPLRLVARISASGQALPAPGDLEGQSEVVSAGAAGVEIRIDTVRR